MPGFGSGDRQKTGSRLIPNFNLLGIHMILHWVVRGAAVLVAAGLFFVIWVLSLIHI